MSFTDALSLHLIRARNIDKVFSFDDHFENSGAEWLAER